MKRIWGSLGDLFCKGLGSRLDGLRTESKEITFKIGQATNSIINMLVRNVERLYTPKEKGGEKR